MESGNCKKWVIIELSVVGEKEKDLSVIKKSVKRILGDLDVFIPAVSENVRGERHTMFYMDGYIFVEYKSVVNYSKVNDTTYFRTVIYNPPVHGVKGSRKTFHTMDDLHLEPIRKGSEQMKLGNLKPGDVVKVIKGTYKNLEGKITEVYESNETAQIFVDLRSRKSFIDFPISHLEKVQVQV